MEEGWGGLEEQGWARLVEPMPYWSARQASITLAIGRSAWRVLRVFWRPASTHPDWLTSRSMPPQLPS